MPADITRRETFRRGLAATSLLALVPDWAMPALAQGETDVPFTDYPKDYKVNGNPNAANRFLDIRKIDGHITPNDQFFFIQRYNRVTENPIWLLPAEVHCGMVPDKPADFRFPTSNP